MTDADEPADPIRDGGLVRVRLDLGYDGAGFAGWAIQPGLRTVQGVLSEALGTLLHTDPVRLVVAGRTDAGVHATGQVTHCDLPADRWPDEGERTVRRLAGLLPPDVRVYSASLVSPDFDARFSALWRRYRYRITDADFGPEPLRRHDTVGWRRRLDAEAMHQAARQLLGLHDFAAFCRRRPGASTIRQLRQLDVRRTGSLIEFEVLADAFCHSMVRSMVGALAAVGEGHRQPDWLAGLLARDRRSDEITVAPAHGLTLLAIGYPDAAEFASRAEQTRALRG
ncbi:MAG TPA: tRNA pseudouridine(38-40) synthase TruA [Jatrophihabitans sp.]|nr:tRNA pseudouridine(38-40) synthase TruA [Jatrophihabitans sp.]